MSDDDASEVGLPGETRKEMFTRFFHQSGHLVNMAQVLARREDGIVTADVFGLMMSALGRYSAMVLTLGGTGEEVWAKVIADLKPMFVTMYDVQRDAMKERG